MRILVIGGTGFIGGRVLRLLSEDGHKLAVFHRGVSHASIPRRVTEILGDRKQLARHAAELRVFGADLVIDVILSSGTQARELVEIFRGARRRLVAISSMDVYRAVGVVHGLEPGGLEPLPLREDSPRRTRLQAYPRETLRMLQGTFPWLDEEYDKIPVEDAVLGESSFEGVVLRLPMVHGPGDPLRRFAPLLAEMEAKPNELIYNAAEAEWRGTRAYVDDVARAIVAVSTHGALPHRVFNVGEPDTLPELEWARLVASAVGWQGRFTVLPPESPSDEHYRIRGNFAQHWVADTSRIRETVGFRESIAREVGIRRTIDSYKT